MLNGKNFRLDTATLGIEILSGKRVAVQVPADSMVVVEAGPTPFDRSMILVSWNGRQLGMFLEDFQQRGELVEERERKSTCVEELSPRR